MATLDNSDYTEIRESIGRLGLKDTFKAWPLNKTQWKAAFQAAEDWFVNGFNSTPASSFKAALETAVGQGMTNAQAQAVGKAWFAWKMTQ